MVAKHKRGIFHNSASVGNGKHFFKYNLMHFCYDSKKTTTYTVTQLNLT